MVEALSYFGDENINNVENSKVLNEKMLSKDW